MEIYEKVQYWIEMADEDLKVADTMLINGHYLYMGFMCHLTIEKAIKSVITQVTEEMPPRSHHLTELAEKAQIHGKMNAAQRSFLLLLNPLNIEGRYPEYKSIIADSLTEERCAGILKETEELLCWIKQQLSAPPTDTPVK